MMMLLSDASIVTQLLGSVMNRLADNEFMPGNAKLFYFFFVWRRSHHDFWKLVYVRCV